MKRTLFSFLAFPLLLLFILCVNSLQAQVGQKSANPSTPIVESAKSDPSDQSEIQTKTIQINDQIALEKVKKARQEFEKEKKAGIFIGKKDEAYAKENAIKREEERLGLDHQPKKNKKSINRQSSKNLLEEQ